MRFFDNNTKNPDAYYEPNSFNGPKEDKRYAEPPLPLHGDADRYNHRDGNDDYTQPGNLFRLLNAEQNQRLLDGIAGSPGLTASATFLRAILVLLSLGRLGEVPCCRLTGARQAGMSRSL